MTFVPESTSEENLHMIPIQLFTNDNDGCMVIRENIRVKMVVINVQQRML